jgi:lysozyme
MKTSEKGINLIKKFEGCRLIAYKCPAGILTIGYGHTRNVHKGEVITQQQADELLKQDLLVYEAGINVMRLNINQNQFDSLVSFAFNLGLGALQKSTLLKRIKVNPNDPKIKDEFLRWSYAGGKQLKGLLLRRQAECDLYFNNN